MKFLNFGSLNIDYVYAVDHIVQPGETISSTGLTLHPGGKGLNQSVALAKAGANVYHAGMVGADGEMLLRACRENNINIEYVRTVEERSGNAIIQVSASGQNSIVLFSGANRENTKEHVDEVLAHFEEGDILLLQNEINLLDYIMERAAEKGMFIALNPSPFDSILRGCPLDKVSLFIMNEVEGNQFTGKTTAGDILDKMRELYPGADVVLTLGKDGAVYRGASCQCKHGIYNVPVVDTTAAGDTFTGYFLAVITEGESPENALEIASVASSIAVSREGATSSIPLRAEVEAKAQEWKSL